MKFCCVVKIKHLVKRLNCLHYYYIDKMPKEFNDYIFQCIDILYHAKSRRYVFSLVENCQYFAKETFVNIYII